MDSADEADPDSYLRFKQGADMTGLSVCGAPSYIVVPIHTVPSVQSARIGGSSYR